jgi:hypothetical protein
MASVNWAEYFFINPFSPGESRTVRFSEAGEFNWRGKVLSVSLWTFVGLFTGDRAMEVTRVVHRSETSSGTLLQFVDVTFKNSGIDPIPEYFIYLSIISE